ncbi:MAG TPA: family 1 glycosylhydrolase [Naasia sp.]|jgi:beta-glucosidase/6-phospho-beta-glucosidase/beta-galactosidase
MTTPWFRDGRLHFALGIEDTFVPQSRPGERAIDEYELTEHYERFDADFALAADVGAGMLRWGVPWYRVAPTPDSRDWDFVDRAVASMHDHGIRPIIDLLHYGTPLWLEGQFGNPDYPERIADFAAAFADRYGDTVTDYTPVNEPVIHALFSGEYGYWPPYDTGAGGFARMAASLARGFVLTQRRIADSLGDRAVFVHVDAGMRYAGAVDAAEHRDHVRRLELQRFLVEDLVTGRVGPDHELAPGLLASGMREAELSWFQERAVAPDVMGVNYYPLHSTEVFEEGVTHGGGFADPRPALDGGVEGLTDVLRTWADRYGAPVMVTETCVTGSVEERIRWMDDSVAAVRRLKADGLDVVGYTWWPLFDMYEWTYRHSTAPRADHLLTMGLFDLVETEHGLARRRTPVADRFRHHATADAASAAPSR